MLYLRKSYTQVGMAEGKPTKALKFRHLRQAILIGTENPSKGGKEEKIKDYQETSLPTAAERIFLTRAVKEKRRRSYG